MGLSLFQLHIICSCASIDKSSFKAPKKLFLITIYSWLKKQQTVSLLNLVSMPIYFCTARHIMCKINNKCHVREFPPAAVHQWQSDEHGFRQPVIHTVIHTSHTLPTHPVNFLSKAALKRRVLKEKPHGATCKYFARWVVLFAERRRRHVLFSAVKLQKEKWGVIHVLPQDLKIWEPNCSLQEPELFSHKAYWNLMLFYPFILETQWIRANMLACYFMYFFSCLSGKNLMKKGKNRVSLTLNVSGSVFY